MRNMRGFPDEAGVFLHDRQKRLVIAINPLQVALGMGFEGTAGLPRKLPKALEISASTSPVAMVFSGYIHNL